MPEIPHFAFPFTRADHGQVLVVEQDSSEHVMGCEEVIVRCPLGWRTERPEFGWAFPEFRTGDVDLSQLEAALSTFEPRGRADARQWADVADAASRHIEITVETEE